MAIDIKSGHLGRQPVVARRSAIRRPEVQGPARAVEPPLARGVEEGEGVVQVVPAREGLRGAFECDERTSKFGERMFS